jgi:ABC-type thiamine transport system ATPase subunit
MFVSTSARPGRFSTSRLFSARENAEEILSLLQLLSEQQGKTIVMVTHDPRAAKHASRKLYLDKSVLSTQPEPTAALPPLSREPLGFHRDRGISS